MTLFPSCRCLENTLQNRYNNYEVFFPFAALKHEMGSNSSSLRYKVPTYKLKLIFCGFGFMCYA